MVTLKTLSIIFIVVLDLGLYPPTVSSQTREGIGQPLGSNYRGRPRTGEGYRDRVGFGEKGNVLREGIGHPLGSIHTVRYRGRPLARDSFPAGEGSPDQVGNGEKGNVVREGIGHPLGSVPTVRFGGARSASGADGVGSGEKVKLVRQGIGYPLGTLPGRYGPPGGFHHTTGGGGGGTNTGRATYRERDNIVLYGSK
ncbi:hypothetical protein LguiA_015334 [Lonicera macranthoides]